MVGLVIVSHSAALAEGVVALAREMGGEEVAIEAAGGMEDGAIGTDAERVRAAIERARSDDGVLVLMDLGSALMSAEIAVEMADPDGGPIRLSDAPLVEGAVAAAASARGGATLDEVAREARGAIRMKTEQLGGDDSDPAQPPADLGSGEELRLRVENRLGLHARPAARFVAALRGLDAEVQVSNATDGRGPADGRSLTGLAVLGVHEGDEIRVLARGPEAAAALDAVRALAARTGATTATPDRPDEPAPERAGGAPEAGARLVGVRRRRRGSRSARAAAAGAGAGRRGRTGGVRRGGAARLDGARGGAARPGGGAGRRRRARRRDRGRDIFDAHALLLDDDALLAPASARDRRRRRRGARLARRRRAAAAALPRRSRTRTCASGRSTSRDVGRRVLGHLAGAAVRRGLDEPGIVVADELTPGEAAALDSDRVYAIATARGGATGHAAILARALGIPAVVGLGEGAADDRGRHAAGPRRRAGHRRGRPRPCHDRRPRARRRDDDAARAERRERAASPERCATAAASRWSPTSAAPPRRRGAVEQGAEGVGLLRTEFLFLDREDAPSEDEQVAVLTEIAAALDGRPLIVRTLDAGADKPLPFLRQAPEDNPFLGRARHPPLAGRPELLRTQLRADRARRGRAPGQGHVPDGRHAGRVAGGACAAGRGARRARRTAALEVGVMVEVPALALAAERSRPRSTSSRSAPTTSPSTRWRPSAATRRWRRCSAGPRAPVLRLDRRGRRGRRGARALGRRLRRARRRPRGRRRCWWASACAS